MFQNELWHKKKFHNFNEVEFYSNLKKKKTILKYTYQLVQKKMNSTSIAWIDRNRHEYQIVYDTYHTNQNT